MNRRALTAIELVVALAVTGLAAAIGAATLGALADNGRRLNTTSDPTERAAAVRRTIVSWLEGARVSVSSSDAGASASFQVLDVSRRGRATDELLFQTTASTPLDISETLVRLYVDDDDRTPEHGLIAELSGTAVTPPLRMELDTDVAEMEVRCLTDLLGGRRWIASWLSSSLLPLGVEVTLRPVRGRQLHPLLRLPIVVAAEGGR